MLSDIVSHWYLFVFYVMILLVITTFMMFIIWCVTYYAICGFNILKFMWIKWIKRQCPHICTFCKYKRKCELKNNPP